MNIQEIIDKLNHDTKTQAVVTALQPFFGVIQREGQKFADDLIKSLIDKDYNAVNELVWQKMTESERDAYSDEVLQAAMKEVDRQYELQKMAKEAAFKIVTSLLSALL